MPGVALSRSGNFVRNSAFGSLAVLSSALAGFLANVIVARLMGVTDAGEVALALWLIAFAATVADLGISSTLERYLPELVGAGRVDLAGNLASALVKCTILATIVLILALGSYAVATYFIGDRNEAELLKWFLIAAGSALQTIALFSSGYLRGMQKFARLAVVNLAAVVTQLTCITVGALLFEVNGAIAGYCAGSFVLAAASLGCLQRQESISTELRNRVIRYSSFNWIGAIASTFVWVRAEVFFLAKYVGPEAVGLFMVGLTLSNLIGQIPMRLTGTALLPYLAETVGRKAWGELQSVFSTATRVQAFLVLPLCFQLAALMPLLVPMLYGSAFEGAIPAAMVTVATAAFASTTSISMNLVHAMDRSDFAFFSVILAVPITLIAGFTLVPTFGLMGGAWSRTLVACCVFPFVCWFVTTRLKCEFPLWDLTKIVCAAALSAILTWVLTSVLPYQPVLLLLSPASIAVYLILIRVFQALPSQDIARIHSLNQNLPSSLRCLVTLALRVVGPGGRS